MTTTALVPYFQVHQPFRLRRYTFFDIGVDSRWFDDAENERIVRRVAERCYVPTNALLLRIIDETAGRFRCAFSISGTAIEQLERWAPEALASFQALARTGCVELLGETSHHSLAFLTDDAEFRAQITDQAARIERVFGRRPTGFRNTELIVDEHVARTVEDLGFRVLLGEGSDALLGWRDPARVYGVEGCERLRLLLRHYRLSDDIAFRFSNRSWDRWPLTAEKFVASLPHAPDADAVVGIFMDYETFGEHQWRETGIFDFLHAMPAAVLADPRFVFTTPTEAAASAAPAARLAIPHPISWADAERDLGAWLSNPMQRAANLALYALLPAVRASGRADLLASWRRLSTSDHLYYMFTKRSSDGDVHEHFSPYATPHDAFIAFMNVLDDLERRVGAPATTHGGATGSVAAAGASPAPAAARAEDPHPRPLPGPAPSPHAGPPPPPRAAGAKAAPPRSRRRVPRGG